jgi:hypothetical protein
MPSDSMNAAINARTFSLQSVQFLPFTVTNRTVSS